MNEMNYIELKQADMRNSGILASLEAANEKGVACKYSEEQILAAQKGEPRKEINDFYNNKIIPAMNCIIYVFYYLASLIALPILFAFQNSEDDAVMRANLIVGIIGYLLLIAIVLVIKIVDKNLKKQMLRRRPWIDLLNKFSADTSVFTYLLTSVGYMLTMMDHFGLFLKKNRITRECLKNWLKVGISWQIKEGKYND